VRRFLDSWWSRAQDSPGARNGHARPEASTAPALSPEQQQALREQRRAEDERRFADAERAKHARYRERMANEPGYAESPQALIDRANLHWAFAPPEERA
jgi:hypothetical protein